MLNPKIDRYLLPKKNIGVSATHYKPASIDSRWTGFPMDILTTVSRIVPSALWPCELEGASLSADWRSTKLTILTTLASLILLNSSLFVAKNLSQDHV